MNQKPKTWTTLVLLAAGITTLFVSSAHAQAPAVDRQLYARLVRECPPDQKACDEALAHLMGAFTRTSKKLGPLQDSTGKATPARSETRDIRFAYNSDCGGPRYSMTMEADPGWEGVVAINPKYGFHIEKSAAHPEYAVTQLLGQRDMMLDSAKTDALSDRVWRSGELRSLFSFEDAGIGKLSAIITDPACRITLLQSLNDGTGLVSLNCERTIDKTDSLPAYTMLSSMVIDPSFHWAVKKLTILGMDVTRSTYAITTKITYQAGNPLPIPDRIEHEVQGAQGGVSQTSLYVFRATSRCDDGAADFHLPKYGLLELPEPVKGK